MATVRRMNENYPPPVCDDDEDNADDDDDDGMDKGDIDDQDK